MGDIKHIVRFGTNSDQKDFFALKDTYDMIAVNANMLAHTTSAMSNFLLKNICSIKGKGYFIDPLTYAFQDHLELLHSKPSKEKTKNNPEIDRFQMPIKPPFVKLIDIYGRAIECVYNNEPIKADFFLAEKNTTIINSFCDRVMNYQLHTVEETLQNDDLGKYLSYCDEDLKKNLRPEFVVAPYFYIFKNDLNQWLEVNIKLCDYCIENVLDSMEIWAQIVLDKEILDDTILIERIADAYMKTNCKGIILWIDGLDETIMKQKEIENYLYLLERLKGKKIYQAYGGFFSILLTNNSLQLLSGVSHGLEYGENRKGYPVGGGVPSSKYYFLPLHKRLDYLTSYDLLEEAGYIHKDQHNWGSSKGYRNDICMCKRCGLLMPENMIGFEEYASSKPYDVEYKTHTQRRLMATKKEKENCRYHYMYCKKVEFALAERRSLDVILQQLEEAINKFKGLTNKKIDCSTMLCWVEILRQHKERHV